MKATKFVGRGMDPPSPLRIAHSGRDVDGERISHSSLRRGRGKLGYRLEPSGLPEGSGRAREAFSAKPVANTHVDADWWIVQKPRRGMEPKLFANLERAEGVSGMRRATRRHIRT